MSDNETINLLAAQKVKESLKNSKRLDNRDFNDFREIKIERGVVSSADGSAKVTLGNTEIIAGVKISVGEPYPDSPDEGSMIFNLELSAISGPDFYTGPPSLESVEYGRVADRAVRSSECIDMSKLSIISGEKMYMIFIDCYVTNADGNLIDAATLAATAALLDVKMPKIDENNKIIYGEYTDQKLPIDINKIPVSVSFEKINNQILVDPTSGEEFAGDTRFSVAVCGNSILSFHKGKTGTFTLEQINQMTEIAVSKYNDIKKKICDEK
jgi:exosome complex component RRP42